jgi:hypothetical protein
VVKSPVQQSQSSKSDIQSGTGTGHKRNLQTSEERLGDIVIGSAHKPPGYHVSDKDIKQGTGNGKGRRLEGVDQEKLGDIDIGSAHKP